ncbi:MAG: TIR domain-containing protein [Allosphingosinicella sp.]
MVDVFISYSRTNQDVVRRLAEAVTGEGYSVWWDAELPPHLSYGDVITEKIGSAKAAIVVWSQSAAASEWVRAEADVARGQKKLIQTSIDDVMPPMPFNQIQFASIGDWRGESDHPGWRKVKASLAALCGPPSEAPRPPKPERFEPPSGAAPRRSVAVLILLGLIVLLVATGVVLLWMQGRKGEILADPQRAPSPVAERSENPERTAQEPPVRAVATPARAEPADMQPADEPALEPGAEPAPRPVSSVSADAIVPDSSTRRLSRADLQGLSRDALFLARNEIFARHGRPFRNPVLQRHFQRFAWYRPQPGVVRLSPVETANVALISQEEKLR